MSLPDTDDNDLLFAPEPSAAGLGAALSPWVVLIVDDEPQVHEVTELVMADFEFAGRHLKFLHAYSAADARKVLEGRDDVALILLDVVMESEHAGLDLARDIREQMGNRRSRIVLRTGQPGQAPEEQVIKNYDINDYKEKTELTKRKLNTVFFAALRSYRDILIIEESKAALRRSIEAIQRVYDSRNLRVFASAVLNQVAHLLGYEARGLCANRISAYATSEWDGRLHILAATPEYAGLLDDLADESLPNKVREALERAEREQRSLFEPHYCVGYYRTSAGSISLLYIEFSDAVDREAQELLEIYCSNVAITYESLLLREEVLETQRDMVYVLGEALERHQFQGGAHVRRISELSALIAAARGMCSVEVEHLRLAAALHDVGMVSVPEGILSKPGKLSADEWAAMQTHTQSGYDLLAQSKRRILRLGAQIALEHHERWDGQGYPRGLAGEAISVQGRIVALADVLDTLVSDRVYKARWDFETALEYIESQAGLHFDPGLVPLLMQNVDKVRALYAQYPDSQLSPNA
ncbi:HD domain-containing phosphohydrolase [Inhella gelatinilytica]|uniref:DUF3369 domain-containing protein n=1 Tax=Inhella gelatinilytica TaxID=2795030 RepID=A0A931IUQ3_9BURK|nr:HD domain-containing phosphohydrolase [Inhella gelatinilytica]MBH9551339.1 DUF3369 domain-containing protein [Inhella gelatinilytica]